MWAGPGLVWMGCDVFAAAMLLGGLLLAAGHQSSNAVRDDDVFYLVVQKWRGRPPDGSRCSRRAGLQQCKSFVEMCIVSCLSA